MTGWRAHWRQLRRRLLNDKCDIMRERKRPRGVLAASATHNIITFTSFSLNFKKTARSVSHFSLLGWVLVEHPHGVCVSGTANKLPRDLWRRNMDEEKEGKNTLRHLVRSAFLTDRPRDTAQRLFFSSPKPPGPSLSLFLALTTTLV